MNCITVTVRRCKIRAYKNARYLPESFF